MPCPVHPGCGCDPANPCAAWPPRRASALSSAEDAPSTAPRVPRIHSAARDSMHGASGSDDEDFPDASAMHAPMLLHAIGWVVACIGWALGVTAAHWLVGIGAFGVPLTMAAGAAWVFVCIGLKRGFVHAAQGW